MAGMKKEGEEAPIRLSQAEEKEGTEGAIPSTLKVNLRSSKKKGRSIARGKVVDDGGGHWCRG